LFEVLLHF